VSALLFLIFLRIELEGNQMTITIPIPDFTDPFTYLISYVMGSYLLIALIIRLIYSRMNYQADKELAFALFACSPVTIPLLLFLGSLAIVYRVLVGRWPGKD